MYIYVCSIHILYEQTSDTHIQTHILTVYRVQRKADRRSTSERRVVV